MDVVLPKWGVSMQEGTVIAWLVEEGAAVSAGELLVEIETDKINAEVESPVDGVLTTKLVAVGERAPVGATLAIVEELGE